MSKYASKSFWADVADRAVSTFAQGTLAAVLASSVTNIVELDLAQSAGVGALAALVSVLQSIATRGGAQQETVLAQAAAVEPYVSDVTGGPAARITYADGTEEHFTA